VPITHTLFLKIRRSIAKCTLRRHSLTHCSDGSHQSVILRSRILMRHKPGQGERAHLRHFKHL